MAQFSNAWLSILFVGLLLVANARDESVLAIDLRGASKTDLVVPYMRTTGTGGGSDYTLHILNQKEKGNTKMIIFKT